MRTGAEYREALRDGRKVWIVGEGLIDDVTTHPATRAMVDEHVAWYDRHFDREWQDIVLTPPDAQGARTPWGFVAPKSAAELRGMGRSSRYNELANAVLRGLSLDMPEIDLSRIREIPLAPRRVVTPPPGGGQERRPG